MSATWQDMAPLLERLESLGDPAVREDARALVALLLRLHGESLARLVDIAREGGQESLLESWKNDAQVAGLLLLHGLHPDDLASRVRRALADVAAVAAFLGVGVSATHVSEEEVRLALDAAPDVPHDALAELRQRLEAALSDRVPEVGTIRVEGGSRRFGLPVLRGAVS